MPSPQGRRSRYLLAVFFGILLGISFPPFGLIGGFVAFVGFVPILIALEKTERWGQAAKIGYVGVFVWALIATYWVGGWKGEGSVDPFLMFGGIALTLLHPLFFFLPILLYDATRRRFGALAALIALPVYWIGFEYLHSLGDLSFPWLNLYNTQTYNLSYIQFIEFTGSYGLTLVILLVNILLYIFLRYNVVFGAAIAKATSVIGVKKKIRGYCIGGAAFLIIVPYIFGVAKMTSLMPTKDGRALNVTIIQPNINPWAKWQTNARAVTDSMYRSSMTAIAKMQSKSDLLLWPETAITYPLTIARTADDLQNLYSFIDRIGAPVLTGIPDREEYERVKDSIPSDAKTTSSPENFYRDWNSALLFYKEPSGKFLYQRYHKQKLVPFGERVPFVDALPVLGEIFKWGVGLGSWNTGTTYDVFALPFKGANATQPDTARLCTMICYESIYPNFVREFVKRGAEIITIVTNDGWYGKSSGPYQHNQFAALRAIENRRWVARSANTGISSVIDDYGQIVKQTELMTSASLTARIPLKRELTLYTRIGDVIAIPCMWVVGIAFLYFGATGLAKKISNRKKKDAAKP